MNGNRNMGKSFPSSCGAMLPRVAGAIGLAALVLLGTAGSGRAGTPAATANDVCASNANPCNVTQVFDVADNATLDFGTRAVSLSGSGQFNFGGGSGTIQCGNFTANITTTNPAVSASGPAAGGGTQSGAVSILARRLCSGGNTSMPCVDLPDCQLGTCGVRRCTLKTAKTCTSDANCQIGPCGANKRCAGSATYVRCTTNADCDYGSCPTQLTCSNRATNPLSCASNADCDFGTCTGGTAASITMGGKIAGASNSPATVLLRASDSITVSKSIDVSSSLLDSDGGDVTLDAATGAVTIATGGSIDARGGGLSQGGAVEMRAGTDITINGGVTVNGGDFDGGSVDLTAGRDLLIARSLLANATAGAGFGGDILVDAGRDISVTGVSSSNRTTIETSGNTDTDNFAGDGGTQDYTSARNFTLGANTRIIGNGALPDGYGSDLFLDVGGNLSVTGTVTAIALGGKGTGGYLEAIVGGTSTLASTSAITLTGGDGGGGSMDFSSAGNADVSGTWDVSGSLAGLGGSMLLDVAANASLKGTMQVGGASSGLLQVDACRPTLAATGKLLNTTASGENRIVARESMKLLLGSQMSASGTAGVNRLVSRDSAKPPVTSGTITPTPVKTFDPTLVGCPVCGNAEKDQGETCDDGNTTNGDGCSSLCQNEKCLAQTASPGYPTVALCDDGNACTTDSCDTTLGGGTCLHPAKDCSDGITCTVDACTAGTGACTHTATDSLCNDSNTCTDDFCSAQTGCAFTANTGACNDNNACTQNDACLAGTCGGQQIPGCGVCGDGTVNPPEACDDGNATFVFGEYCGVGCVRIPCGKPTNSSGTLPKASDALFTLKAAVGAAKCSVKVCDVNASNSITAADALRILKKAVNQVVTLTCPL